MDGWGEMAEWMDGVRWLDGWMGWMAGWMDGVRWLDGWMDGEFAGFLGGDEGAGVGVVDPNPNPGLSPVSHTTPIPTHYPVPPPNPTPNPGPPLVHPPNLDPTPASNPTPTDGFALREVCGWQGMGNTDDIINCWGRVKFGRVWQGMGMLVGRARGKKTTPRPGRLPMAQGRGWARARYVQDPASPPSG